MFRAMGTGEIVMSGNRQPVSLEPSSQLKGSTRKFAMKYASIEGKERTRTKLCLLWGVGYWKRFFNEEPTLFQQLFRLQHRIQGSEIHASSWTDERQDVSYLKWRRSMCLL